MTNMFCMFIETVTEIVLYLNCYNNKMYILVQFF